MFIDNICFSLSGWLHSILDYLFLMVTAGGKWMLRGSALETDPRNQPPQTIPSPQGQFSQPHSLSLDGTSLSFSVNTATGRFNTFGGFWLDLQWLFLVALQALSDV